MTETDVKLTRLKYALGFFSYLLVVWGFYRLIFEFPEWVEEIVLKPLIWLVPMVFLIVKEKSTLSEIGVNFRNLSKTMYFVLALGVLFVLEAMGLNYLKHGGLNFAGEIGGAFWYVFGISLVTAIVEELVYRGYIFSRVWDAMSNEWVSNLVTSVGWTILHFPVALFGWELRSFAFVITMGLVFIFSMGSGFIFARTRNVFGSILLHLLWQWPIILFR